jgi:murein DD-endopeptidase MepM/ murein hydrolase activator NlpD
MKRAALALAALLLVAAGDPKTETEHVVARGETLRSIASKAGVPISVIAEANGMLETARVRVGEKLVIPRQQSHTVKRGETAFGIAYQYGVTWEQIAVANGLAANAVPRPGQKLIIPALMPTSAAPPSPAARPTVPGAPAFRRPLDGEVLLGWQRRADGTGHEGIDYAANVGDAVHAAAAGRVIFAGNVADRFGNLVVLDHGNGWHTAYGNLSRITVKVGARVKAGERIGLAGQTGEARRPELHFEIRRGTDPVDPAPLLRD